jgi:hypothetical protein
VLPPYFPSYRGQDRLFATLLGILVPDSYITHLPFTLTHDPQEARKYEGGRDAQIRMVDLVGVSLSSWQSGIQKLKPAERMRSLGEHLTAVSQLSIPEFRMLMCSALLSRRAALIRHCRAVRDEYQHDQASRSSDLEMRIEQLCSAACHISELQPTELRMQDKNCSAINEVQHQIGTFAELLSWWPTLLDVTKQLKARGVELGRLIAR